MLAVALADDRVAAVRVPDIALRYRRVSDLANSALTAQRLLEDALTQSDSTVAGGAELDDLSRLSAQLPVQIKRIKQALRVAGVSNSTDPELFRLLNTVKLAARSLSARVLEFGATIGEPMEQ